MVIRSLQHCDDALEIATANIGMKITNVLKLDEEKNRRWVNIKVARENEKGV